MELVGPFELFQRKMDPLHMRLVRELGANPWPPAAELEFDDAPWDQLHGSDYDLDDELHQPIDVLVGMLRKRLSLFDTQMMEVIKGDGGNAQGGQAADQDAV